MIDKSTYKNGKPSEKNNVQIRTLMETYKTIWATKKCLDITPWMKSP